MQKIDVIWSLKDGENQQIIIQNGKNNDKKIESSKKNYITFT